MDEILGSLFLDYSAEKLSQLSARVSECIRRLSYEQIWQRGSGNENAVGNLVLHLCGNVRQWIGFGVAGKPDVRKRDREFAARGDIHQAELVERLNATVAEALTDLRNVTPRRLQERVKIQAYELSVLEAVYHVIEHFAQHAGQIIFAAKQLTGEDLGFYKHLGKPSHTEQTP